ncbi:DctP family TRAP transporter solute-binding subunit [Aliivibrio fischeri]|uniref:TRAP transporter substrate-binding protein n=1 Tax=Aliivibrio fischeri TaxID=668 RepID=UPI0012D871AB|nr:TRAP transporter substrate-binding protein [Aliivibrio fischeri]MUI55196.1 DctP family TRAP transporter solute-binding subunit [Aliivibrio fischeri]MUK36521.1 DctP family TRAP transporter solute-binding subunit [Aliivibrio fischeri]MUL05814.1 DctP family TRAP transporter solute-binding subunit [Aliivibrio fischeri]MUL16995.1 DctP family TRAP transporter solute-binding subunit [Aliivibrio fischeri]
MKLNKLFSLCAVSMIAVSSYANAAKTMRIGIGVPESHFEYAAMKKFEEHVEQATNNSIDVKVFANNQLGNDQEALEAIKQNIVQMNLPSPAVLANIVKDFNILSLPFIFPTEDIANQVVDGEWGQKLASKLERAGYVGLGYGNFGFRHVTNNTRPIVTAKDFDGLKLRTMQNKAHLDSFRALGANPTPMAFSELFSSLQQGVVDGQENPYTNIYSQRLYEVQKYVSNTGHVYSWVVFVVGKRFYNGLSEEEQTALNDAAKIAIDHMRISVREQDKQSLQNMIDAGLVYTEISPEEKAKMREIVAPVVQQFADDINPELYRELTATVDSLQ